MPRARKPQTPPPPPKPKVFHKCGECANVVEETKFHTLSLKGKPTLGRCPHYMDGKVCVLLSQMSCDKFVEKNETQ